MEEEDIPYTNALKAESALMGKEWLKFGPSFRSAHFVQKSYLGEGVDFGRGADNMEATKNGVVSSMEVPVIDESGRDGLLSINLASPKNQEQGKDLRNDLGDLSKSDLCEFIECDMIVQADRSIMGDSFINNDLNINLPAIPPPAKKST